jgi:hypothetical protein
MAVAVVPASAAVGKSVSSSQLKTLQNLLGKGKHLTYEAVYKSVSGGQTTTVTIAQAPPKSVFSTSSGQVINTGKSTYYCGSSSGKETCANTGSGTNPFLGLESLFSSGAAAAALTEAKTGLVTRVLGIKSTASSANFAGQSSTCLTVNVRGKTSGKFCFTKQGILAYSGSSSTQYFQLTKYVSNPPSSLFQLPAGASTVTIPSLPGGVTIPSVP